MDNTKLRYGVAGLGRAGWNMHVASLRGREDAVVAAVVDPLEERLKEAADEFGCRTYTDVDDMLADGGLDVVVVATPSVDHGPQSIAAMRAGCHVAVDKPLATSVAQADEMIAVSEETGKKLFVHQNRRFSPEYLHLKQLIESGRLGRIYHIRFCTCRFRRRNDWQTLSKYGGGLLNNTGPHFLDLALQLIGSPVTRVAADMQQIVSAGDSEDHVKALLHTASGATIDLEISDAQKTEGPMLQWVICGTCGTATSDGKKTIVNWFDPAQAPPIEVIDGAAEGRAYGNKDELPWQREEINADDTPAIGDFYDMVTDVLLRDKPMYITPESVRELIRVIAEIRKAAHPPAAKL